MRTSYLSLIFILCVIFSSAQAWWETPHMLVAQIAYDQLTPQAKKRANELIALHAAEYPRTNDFVSAAVWADDIKLRGNRSYSNWHYVTLKFKRLDDPMPTRASFPAKNQVAWAVNEELKILQDPDATEGEKGLALRRLIHWVGDIHQPLHAASHVSSYYPKGDSGGNRFLLNLPAPYDTLHKLWDSGLDRWERVARPLNPKAKTMLSKEAKRLHAVYARKDLGSLDPYEWALESHRLSREVVYNGIAYEGIPSAEYIDRGRKVSEMRVTLAGQRLGKVLNQALVQ